MAAAGATVSSPVVQAQANRSRDGKEVHRSCGERSTSGLWLCATVFSLNTE